MGSKMLIDAAHPEETRVVVVNGNRVDEFDFESETKKQLRGNIYLARVTRVEPSLQAAFVEYGGNRHGFLAFSEIHPDYYQIPVADREALLKQYYEEERRDEEEDERQEKTGDANGESTGEGRDGDQDGDQYGDPGDETENDGEAVASDDTVEDVGAGDALEEISAKKERRTQRSYKIQEVIKRRQILLVQVVKEERGNKGAALTTYLSLAGRYCVLMPNTARGGGISRKITNAADRKRLKSVTSTLDVPEGMGLIVRTAGAQRTKAEIKRDFEYLLRLWETVRERTLESIAPCLVYEEGSLIKRSIRDLYNKDIDTVQVEGEEGYREAKDFMRMLMPSHAKKVQPYKENHPLFQRHQVEQQLDAMFSPIVTLKSGGYLVINQTEALVSIDINSGRSTKERNIEATAVKTNLEAAEEIARQLRLRDLAGLIVIDFIDMEENRNNRAVERKMKDCLKMDRARIQVGRISHFGLLEMSRQRMRTGVLEGSTMQCPTCQGAGIIRSVESKALHVLREIEAEAIKGRAPALTARVPDQVALYILNQKRGHLLEIEERYGLSIYVEADPELGSDAHRIEAAGARELTRKSAEAKAADSKAISYDMAYTNDADGDADGDVQDEEDDGDEETGEDRETSGDGDDQPKKKRRRRRRKPARKDGDEEGAQDDDASENNDKDNGDADDKNEGDDGDTDEDGKPKRRRRRGRRGGRRNRQKREGSDENSGENDGENDGDEREKSGDTATEEGRQSEESGPEDSVLEDNGGNETPLAASSSESEPPVLVSYTSSVEAVEEVAQTPAADVVVETPAPKAEVEAEVEAEAEPEATTEPAEVPEAEREPEMAEAAPAGEADQAEEEPAQSKPRSRKRGWWQRKTGG